MIKLIFTNFKSDEKKAEFIKDLKYIQNIDSDEDVDTLMSTLSNLEYNLVYSIPVDGVILVCEDIIKEVHDYAEHLNIDIDYKDIQSLEDEYQCTITIKS